MATKEVKDRLVAQMPEAEENKEPTVRVFIPLTEEDNGTVKTDHYEHVTINGESYAVMRGQYVDVPVPVFIQLRNKYPNI